MHILFIDKDDKLCDFQFIHLLPFFIEQFIYIHEMYNVSYQSISYQLQCNHMFANIENKYRNIKSVL